MRHKYAWFWEIIKHYLPLYVHVGMASFMVNTFGLAMPLFVMNVYDRIIPNSAFESLWVLTTGILLVAGLEFFLRNARAHFVEASGKNIDVLMHRKFMATLARVRLDVMPSTSVGALMAKARDFEYIRDFLGSSTLIALLDVPFVIIFITLIAMLGGTLAWIPVLAIPSMLLFTYLVQRPFEEKTQKQNFHTIRKNALLGEIAAGFETTRAARLNAALGKRWDILVENTALANQEAKHLGSLIAHFIIFINIFLSVLLVIVGVYRIDEGVMSMGALIACVILFGRCMAPLSSFVALIGNVHRARLGFASLDNLIHLSMENTHADYAQKILKTQEVDNPASILTTDITFEKVSFHYPSHESAFALADIDVCIKKNEKVAFLGHSGSGKSSIARLIAGLYMPNSGRITYGNLDIRHAPMDIIRKNIGYLPQQITLFSGTIRSNICNSWQDDVPFSEEALVQLAHMCGVMDFAKKHPLGLDMPIADHGVGLSGGQAQSVALARALVGKPNILILDEPTSNLDMESEKKLLIRLKPYLENKTVIIFTHRTSLLELADRLIVMQNAHIIKDVPLRKIEKI